MLATTYDTLVSSGRLQADASQSAAVLALRRFARLDDGWARAVYLWGSVGSGKSMLMDLLVGACAEHAEPARGTPARSRLLVCCACRSWRTFYR